MKEERVTLGEVIAPRREKGLPSEQPDLPFIGLEHSEAHTLFLNTAMAAFDGQGGLGRMWELFGDQMDELIEELNEALVA